MTSKRVLRAPFPWFGGKSLAAPLIWRAFGNVPNYVEPFAGSLAVLLARPSTPKVETVNDKDGLIANFWRAVKAAPDEVARWADWPVNEADLHARHQWLVAQAPLLERLIATLTSTTRRSPAGGSGASARGSATAGARATSACTGACQRSGPQGTGSTHRAARSR
jgi:hypothetical protein